MNLPKFLYYILTKDGRSAKVVNKTVTFVGQPTHLPQTPDGWQQISLAWERSNELHGLSGNFSLNFGHVLDACRICTDTAYRHTTEKELFLLINQLKLIITPGSPVKYKWLYKYFHKQEINLSECEDERDMFKAPLMPGGIDKLIKANWETVFSFPMNDIEAVNLTMVGISLTKKGSFILIDGFEIDNVFYGGSSWAPFLLVNTEGNADGMAFFTQDIENTSGISLADRLESSSFFAKAGGNVVGSIDIHITGKIVYQCTEQDAANGFLMRFLKSTQNISNQNDYLLFIDSPLVEGEIYSHDIDVTIHLAANERCYFEMNLATSGVDTKIQFSPDSKLSVEFSYAHETTIIKAFERDVLFKKIIKAITGSDTYASSSLCEKFKFLLITCGDAIRGIETAILKTSLADFFQDTDCTLMAGFDVINDKVEIESREKYYPSDDSDAVDLGEVTDFVKKPAKDKKCNTFKFGHQKQDIEDVNGRYDPNGNNQFIGPLTKDVKELNMVSPYKAGPYEIEILRIGLNEKDTTDNNSDSDVFVIAGTPQPSIYNDITVTFDDGFFESILISNTIPIFAGQQIKITGSTSNDGVYDIDLVLSATPTQNLLLLGVTVIDEVDAIVTIEILLGKNYTLNRPTWDSIEGVPTDTIFNLPYLTPLTMLRRHKRWLAGINAGLLSNPVKFLSSKDNKNSELKTVLSGVVTDEDAPEMISNPMFLPWYFIFKTKVPVDLPELLEENPNRIFKFRDENGNEFKGFLQMAGIAPNDYTPQEFRLLATPDNDLTLLIHG